MQVRSLYHLQGQWIRLLGSQLQTHNTLIVFE